MLAHLLEHPSSSRLIQHPALTLVGARRGHQRIEAALFVPIPPILQCAHGVIVAIFIGPRLDRSLAQSADQRTSLTLQVLNEVQRPKASQSQNLVWVRAIFIWVIHTAATLKSNPTPDYLH